MSLSLSAGGMGVEKASISPSKKLKIINTDASIQEQGSTQTIEKDTESDISILNSSSTEFNTDMNADINGKHNKNDRSIISISNSTLNTNADTEKKDRSIISISNRTLSTDKGDRSIVSISNTTLSTRGRGSDASLCEEESPGLRVFNGSPRVISSVDGGGKTCLYSTSKDK